jgi:hypothetical protein
MKRVQYIGLLFLLLIFCIDSDAQDTVAKPSRFAIVYVAVYKENATCIVKYSNGTQEDLCTALNLGTDRDFFLANKHEFKILEYFYKKDYDLIATAGNLPYQLFFKHK